MKNQLYFGDNLDIMRKYIPDESVDLIYLDPPFKSDATYNVLFQEKDGERSRAQITAFDDTWHWGRESEEAYHEIVTQGATRLASLMQALRGFLGQNDMMAYLTMMAIRLVEMHRVLKPTGSIYLHCDPKASHYLKLVLDSIFSYKFFQNEIIWHYRRWSNVQNRYQKMHDVIFFYTKANKGYTFNPILIEFSDSQKKKFKRGYDTNVIHTKTGKYKQLIVYDKEKVKASGIDLSKYKNYCRKRSANNFFIGCYYYAGT